MFVSKEGLRGFELRVLEGGWADPVGQWTVINLNNMEGIANFIIPMLKNQTVNTNPHLFQINKLKSTKT